MYIYIYVCVCVCVDYMQGEDKYTHVCQSDKSSICWNNFCQGRRSSR